MTRGFLVAAAAIASLIAPGSASGKPVSRTAVVIVDKLAFGAVPSNSRVGDTIKWVNRDLFRHSATSAGHFDVDLPPGATRRMVLRQAGFFVFLCKYHPGMKGVLRVSR